jgi:hypothetical protein
MVGLQMRLDLKRHYGILATQAYKYTVLMVDFEETIELIHL